VRTLRWAATLAAAFASSLATAGTPADAPAPPWVGAGEVPPPRWARSVAPRAGDGGQGGDLVLFAGPTRASERRGVTLAGASLPFFGVKRGSGCSGVWWLVGPLAWACSDGAELSAAPAGSPAASPAGSSDRGVGADGLSVPYFFVRGDGASAYVSLDSAADGAADRELEGGWAVAVVEQRVARSGLEAEERFARTSKGLWLALRDLSPARPSLFHGEAIHDGVLDVAWVRADRASVWPEPSTKAKPTGSRARFELLHLREESGPMVRIDDGAWMLARDIARPSVAPPPIELARASERWIDVEVATQTLVAYDGSRPVYATLVSTGRGESATPTGVHRIWVKLLASDMDNVERGDLDAHYSLEDVPYTQFFQGGVALHGTYWHRDFGHARSHGCVNLAPLDARWLFGFTGPRMPAGWVAVYPTPVDQGTAVRVR
jgi:lipoprotein-anchoring transpeptidase ErfK/SrfK